jgi:hypothetical protein
MPLLHYNELQPQFKIPDPFKAHCHLCEKSFASIEELMQHTKDIHRVWKG